MVVHFVLLFLSSFPRNVSILGGLKEPLCPPKWDSLAAPLKKLQAIYQTGVTFCWLADRLTNAAALAKEMSVYVYKVW